MSRRTRRTVLVLHIVSSGAWVGIDVLLGTLALTAWFTSSDQVAALAYQALGLFVWWPMAVSALVCLLSGLLLGLGTKYGLLRYWWVAVKLAMNLVLLTLVVFLLRPGLDDVEEYGRQLVEGNDAGLDVSFLFFPPLVSLTALTIAMGLSVFKPWGRTRGSRR
jgi:hypothetical protein